MVDPGYLATFAAGLLSSLSPCIYPLIPITLSVIGANSPSSIRQGLGLSCAYVFGLASLYATLGAFFGYFGKLLGSWLQSPWVNLFLCLAMLSMAASMFDVFSWNFGWGRSVGLRSQHRKGYLDAFLTGLTAAFVATPCTGPVIAAVLSSIMHHQNIWYGVVAMMFYALGMGLPMVVLGTLSSALQKLPKSGSWLKYFKWVLGVWLLYLSWHHAQLAWKGFRAKPVPASIHHAINLGKPVILDFWADWCVLCESLEKTLQEPEVQEALQNYTLIRIDFSIQSKDNDLFQNAYDITGLPALVFLKTGEKISGPISKEELLKRLQP